MQLSDDDFAFGGTLLAYEAARAALRDAASPPAHIPETVNLSDLAGRVLAEPIVARANVPPFDNSAVDGYAFCKTGDKTGDTEFTLLPGVIAAGRKDPPSLTAGQAIRILTGTPIPKGADTVVMEEDAAIDGQTLTIPAALSQGANLRKAGEDVALGRPLYPAGHLISALDCARLAAAGIKQAAVAPPLRIALLSSGDEIKSGQVPDANRWVLQAVFSGPAFDVAYGGIVGDDVDETRAALRGLAADLIITSGGVSVGERDVLRTALEAEGTLNFWRVGIKPGRPVAFGRLKNGTPFFGLPGNPVACFVTAQFLARPFALACVGAEPQENWLEVELAVPHKKKAGRTEFVRVHVDAQQRAIPYGVAGAGILSSLTQTDGILRLDADLTQIAAGTPLPYLPFRGLML